MNKKLSSRQLKILNYLTDSNKSRIEIEELLSTEFPVSKVTVVRDLGELIEKGFIKQQGSGPSTYYSLTNKSTNLPIYDIDEYFKTEVDNRKIKGLEFNKDLLDEIKKFFDKLELAEIEISRNIFKNIMNKRDSTEVKKELERFIIELSWKSSKIEGNTYTLLDTENLIKNNIHAPNNTKEESQMILNHKDSFDYVMKNLDDFKHFSQKNLKQIHSLIVKDLDIQTDYRLHSVGIAGTKYIPIDNKYQIEDAINSLELKLKKIKSPFIQAFATLVFISYIQPFSDGNKRTARMLSNSILVANNYYPLSYRSVDEIEYKKALIIFYEQFNIWYFKQIYLNQYEFSMKNYFKS